MRTEGPQRAALIGAVFGLVFVLVNAGGLESSWPLVARVAGVLAFLVVLLLLVGSPADALRLHQPTPTAWRTYWVSVLVEVVALFVGTRLLSTHGHGDLGVAWVAVVVGVHFLPFSRAFGARAFLVLGWALVLLGALGLGLGLAGAPGWVVPLVAGIGSGAALLVFAGWHPAVGRVRAAR